jgi:TonB family protein
LKYRAIITTIGLALLVGGSAVLPQIASAQSAVAESGKRKVRSSVDPAYPETAKQMHVGGRVKIEVTISPEGRVSSMRVIGGSPLLVNAAKNALNMWRFEPAPKETSEIYEFAFDRDK